MDHEAHGVLERLWHSGVALISGVVLIGQFNDVRHKATSDDDNGATTTDGANARIYPAVQSSASTNFVSDHQKSGQNQLSCTIFPARCTESELPMRFRRVVAAVLVASFVAPLAAVGSRKAEYIGGTIAGLEEGTEGTFVTSDPDHMRFQPEKKGQTAVQIPYASVTSLEYGQKAGRRVGVAIMVNPLALFSKKRKHFLTVSFNGADGKEQAMVLELGKDIIRTSLTVVETRSGKAIEYQDEDARKASRGGN